jgi:acetoin utilization deacetylase AcuC-like enzyme
VLLMASERFAEHTTPPGHPERPERAEIFDVVAARWRGRGAVTVEPRLATRDELLRVHTPRYLEALAATAGRAVSLDPDTYTSPESYEIARLAAGAACQGVEHAMREGGPAAALVRPPGHHAEADRAMGFCLFNNVAVAAAHARALGAERVAVVDIDVHHGNGTQWMFYADPSVFYVSLHQYPYYPGTGAADDVGKDEGRGFTLNVPLAAGATDADYDLVFRSAIVPVLENFEADLLLVSAGYDAHHRDPLGAMRVSTEGYAAMMAHLWGLACATSARRLVLVTEGGYDLPALADGLEVSLEVLSAAPAPPPPARGEPSRGRTALAEVRAAQAVYWPAL